MKTSHFKISNSKHRLVLPLVVIVSHDFHSHKPMIFDGVFVVEEVKMRRSS